MKYRLPLPVHRYFFGTDEPQDIAEIRAKVDTWPEVDDNEVLDCAVYKDPRTISLGGYKGFAENNIRTGRRAELAELIREHGVIVPLLVTEKGGMVNGNHRTLLAVELGIKKVPLLYLEEFSD